MNESTEILLVVAAAALCLLWAERDHIRARRMCNPFTRTGRRIPDSHFTKAGQPKVGYPTKKEAMVEARRLQRGDGARMDAYRCSGCRQWHVGHAR